jgi:hypothetical protein
MVRRLLQILLIASLVGGATAQALGCISMQSEGHACCRMISMKKASQKMRAIPSSHQVPAKSSNCCESNPSRSQQPPLENRDSKREEAAIIANAEGVATLTATREASPPSRLLAPSDYSPPHFILYHSLLI